MVDRFVRGFLVAAEKILLPSLNQESPANFRLVIYPNAWLCEEGPGERLTGRELESFTELSLYHPVAGVTQDTGTRTCSSKRRTCHLPKRLQGIELHDNLPWKSLWLLRSVISQIRYVTFDAQLAPRWLFPFLPNMAGRTKAEQWSTTYIHATVTHWKHFKAGQWNLSRSFSDPSFFH